MKPELNGNTCIFVDVWVPPTQVWTLVCIYICTYIVLLSLCIIGGFYFYWLPPMVRDRPFNLQGGGLWFFVSVRIFFPDNTRVSCGTVALYGLLYIFIFFADLWSAKKKLYIYIKDHKGLRFRNYTRVWIFNFFVTQNRFFFPRI